ncbi:ATP-dependent helicase, partial [Mycobacterium avium]|uniref:UvrD-helicase domain-containing protein n=1 Tax=Mycobacterium avium TaxID=1764 RepID=UPI001DE92ADF
MAITFKRDAATNIRRRVAQRTPGHAARFMAMTFDAFTKSVVDRFHSLLPEYWTMKAPYVIRYAATREVGAFLDDIAGQVPQQFAADVRAIPQNDFVTVAIGKHALPVSWAQPTTAIGYAIQQWWQRSYIEPEVPAVDFVMLNRLAELVIRHSPRLQRALHETYPFVFVDEFQDTTYAQYTFLRAVFGRRTTVTAVGDRKQRIMGWAGALDDAFAEFTADFSAIPYELLWNFRSTHALVALQHRFAQLLDPSAEPAAAQAISDIDDQPAQLWSFSNNLREAGTVAAFIAADIASSDRSPSDYALVARQKVADFEPALREALATHDIALRNDDALCGQMRLQDLLKDAYSELLIGFLRLAARSGRQQSDPRTWINVSTTLTRLRSGDDLTDDIVAYHDDNLSVRLRILRSWLRTHACSAENVAELFEHLTAALADLTDHHLNGLVDTPDDLAIRAGAFQTRLKETATQGTSWWDATRAYDAAAAVPLLTIHRSKGLEYHTVFVLGLDDDPWWSHRRDTTAST